MGLMDYIVICVCVLGTVALMYFAYLAGVAKGKEEIRAEVMRAVFDLIAEIEDDKR